MINLSSSHGHWGKLQRDWHGFLSRWNVANRGQRLGRRIVTLSLVVTSLRDCSRLFFASFFLTAEPMLAAIVLMAVALVRSMTCADCASVAPEFRTLCCIAGVLFFGS
jgi:hypothetical protein